MRNGFIYARTPFSEDWLFRVGMIPQPHSQFALIHETGAIVTRREAQRWRHQAQAASCVGKCNARFSLMTPAWTKNIMGVQRYEPSWWSSSRSWQSVVQWSRQQSVRKSVREVWWALSIFFLTLQQIRGQRYKFWYSSLMFFHNLEYNISRDQFVHYNRSNSSSLARWSTENNQTNFCR